MEDLEQIMRKIHVLFAKCEAYGKEKDNKIIVPKKEVFRLLEQLNYAVVKLMDQYEGTEESRERGMGEYRRKGERIIEEAQAGAEDIYAASLVYTDNMINELEAVLSEARENIRVEYARMAKQLDEQAMMLFTNQEEIKGQLLAMSQGEKYLKLILRENRRRQLEEEEDWEEEEGDWEEAEEDFEEERPEDGEIEFSEVKPGTEEEEEADSPPEAGMPEEEALEKSEGNDLGAKEKPNGKKTGGQRPGSKKSGKAAAGNKKRKIPDLETEWKEEERLRSVRKIGTAVYQEVGQPYDPPPKKVSYEIKVNEAYFEQLGEGNVDLDAEYEQWKKEQEGEAEGNDATEDAAAAIEETGGKKKLRWFGRKKT